MDSPTLARLVVEELLSAGVTDVVVCPGSRSAPIALTLADAERRGLVRLHVRIDERSGAYLALGLARASRRPAAVVTTSGTAAVNLHPAVVEAAYSGVPLITITADRPDALRGRGANQTIDQRELYGVDAVAWVDLDAQEEDAARAAVAACLDAAIERRGPVQVNVPLAEPLVASGSHAIGSVVPRGVPQHDAPDGADLRSLVPTDVDIARGLLIVGDADEPQVHESAARLATALGWPVISEPSGNLSRHPGALRHGPLILGTAFAASHVPDVVVTIGRVGLHRPELALLRASRVHLAVDVAPRLGRVDPASTAAAILDAVPEAIGGAPDAGWLSDWRSADDIVAAAVEAALDAGPMTGASVARLVAGHATPGDLLVVGASFPVRHVSSFAGALRARCIGNRGTSGIDGVVSTAWGAAIAHGDDEPGGTTYALVGDLTALYDRNGLLAAPTEALPRLDYVVVDNDGGGIFSSLEQGAPEFAADFERVFGTPHGGDLTILLSGPRIAVLAVESPEELADALDAPTQGVRVIVARCAPRAVESALVESIEREVRQALS